MTQPFQTRSQRITIIITLLALVIVIARNVTAGTKYVTVKKTNIEQCSSELKSNIISLASELEELPWSPFVAFFR